MAEDTLSDMAKRTLNQTSNLASKLKLKRNCHVMLATNVDISDRLISSQLGYIYNFGTNIGTVTKKYILSLMIMRQI